MPDGGPGVSVYLHYPYCKSGIQHSRLEDALLTDLEASLSLHVDDLVPAGSDDHSAAQDAIVPPGEPLRRRIHSVYFGGGTPSLARPEMVARVLQRVQDLGMTPSQLEVTLEANPTSVEASKLRAFKAAGINRLSLGVQSLDPDALRFLGRDHSAKEALEAIETALDVFDNVSLDFIWGRPGQTVAAWERELQQVTALGASHLSLYQLTVERGTPLFKQVQKHPQLMPGEDEIADLFEATRHVASLGGYEQYEVSSFCRGGMRSNRGQHNQSYWNGNDYIGVGPGSHGRLWNGVESSTFKMFSNGASLDSLLAPKSDELRELERCGLLTVEMDAEGIITAVLLAIAGKDFVLTASDDTSARSIVVMKRGEDKSVELTKHSLMLYSGESGDTVQFAEYIQRNVRLYGIRHSIELSPNAVASFTRREMAESLRSRNPYHVNVLIAGVSPKTGVPELYWIDYISNMCKLNFAAHGYASYFCLSTMDRYWRDDLTVEEAKALMRKCLEELRTRFVGNLPNFFVKVVDANGIHTTEL
nr:radical S-adenosyl methionine domain-containing protein 1 [Polyrhizophydium stewartii]